MRLFVALVLPADVVAGLSAAVQPLRAAAPELRWTSPDAWHLTLAFLGEVEDSVVPELSVRLERAASRHHAQQLAVAGGGAFPAASRARVLWAGIHADRTRLAGLAASVAAGARRAGAPPPDEQRRYRPHLTLARCSKPADVSSLIVRLAGYQGRHWTAEAVHLIRSEPADGLHRYHQLDGWPLRPTSQAEPG